MKIPILSTILACMCMAVLAFETKDYPPPTPTPTPSGYKVYTLSEQEANDMATMWLKSKNIPITGKITFLKPNSFGSISTTGVYVATTASTGWIGDDSIRIWVAYPSK